MKERRAKERISNPAKSTADERVAYFSPPCSLHYERLGIAVLITEKPDWKVWTALVLLSIVYIVAAAFCSGELKRGNLIHSGGSN